MIITGAPTSFLGVCRGVMRGRVVARCPTYPFNDAIIMAGLNTFYRVHFTPPPGYQPGDTISEMHLPKAVEIMVGPPPADWDVVPDVRFPGEEADATTCNQCGGTMLLGEPNTLGSTYGLECARFITGYYSVALPDMTRYTFSLCEPCVAKLMAGFKIPPRTQGLLFG